MSSYILRNIDPDLWHQVKSRAASEGRGLRWVVLYLLAEYAAHGLTRRPSPDSAGAVARSSPPASRE